MKTKNVLHESSKGYIIDLYNRFAKNDNVISVFKIHGQEYCVREITQFNWGKPVFDRNIDDDFDDFCVYNTIEEALGYIKYLKQLEGSRF